MPRLWNETVEAHRADVRNAILDTTWSLVLSQGIVSVTMSQIAQQTGIGRATLYKYFPDVEAILLAFHERHVAAHHMRLAALRDGPGEPGDRLAAVLRAYALITHHRGHHADELIALLHPGDEVTKARQPVLDMVRDLLTEVAGAGSLRADVPIDELASYCLHALSAAADLPSEDSVGRLVTVTLSALPPSGRSALP